MIIGKYAKDYELRESVDPASGRARRDAVYVGPYFTFDSEDSELKTAKTLLTAIVILASAALLVTLLVYGDILMRWYVMVPLILTIPPVALLVQCVFRAHRAGERVTRERKDQISARLAPWSMVLMILSGLSLVGQIYFDISGGMGGINIVVHVCTIILFAAGLIVFFRRDDFKMKEIE